MKKQKAPGIVRRRTSRPRTKPPEARRRDLLDAAARLFLKRGVAATSVDEIVARAGIAKGTFYLHFESKEALLIALRRRFVEEFLGDLRAAMDRCADRDWGERLRAWVEAGVGGYLNCVKLHDVVFHEFRPDKKRVKDENPVVGDLSDFLGDGVRAGAWAIRDPDLTATMLFHAMHGAVDAALGSKRVVDRDRLVGEVETFFRRAVGLS